MTNPIQTPSGRIEGSELHDIRVFKGVPYAAPPTGKLRFRPPESPQTWQGVRPALQFGSAAPQVGPVGRMVRQWIGVSPAGQNEDCLTLNVWAPEATGPPRPVLVWIHGGAFLMGSGSTRLYWGSRLAKRGNVVVVTLNYRLGALGFLDLTEATPQAESTSANLGILDQIAALEWVRDHIEAFGGDPEQVTIFGESAGAMSVGTLLGTPRASGLFRRAILQSGAAHNVSTRERSAAVADSFLGKLGLKRPTAEGLRKLDLEQILEAQSRTTIEMGLGDGRLPWQPSVDGDVLPEAPLEAIAKGLSADVPVLLGTNRDEWKLFMIGDRKGHRLDEAGLRRRMDRTLRSATPDPALQRQISERAYETYRTAGGERRSASPSERWVAFQSDRIFHHPAQQLADLQSATGATTYSYLFDWAPPMLSGRIGACHGIEIPFVFGTLRDPWMRPWLGATRSARRLSHQMQASWLSFARTGHPGHERVPYWAPYTREHRATLAFGRHPALRESLFDKEREFWQSLP